MIRRQKCHCPFGVTALNKPGMYRTKETLLQLDGAPIDDEYKSHKSHRAARDYKHTQHNAACKKLYNPEHGYHTADVPPEDSRRSLKTLLLGSDLQRDPHILRHPSKQRADARRTSAQTRSDTWLSPGNRQQTNSIDWEYRRFYRIQWQGRAIRSLLGGRPVRYGLH